MKELNEEQLQDACDVFERIIGETTVADGITVEKESGWRRVIEELTQVSIKNARRMGEGFPPVNKGSHTIPAEQWVHARVFAMILELSAWMGMQWKSHFGCTKADFLQLLGRAYEAGECLEARRRRA